MRAAVVDVGRAHGQPQPRRFGHIDGRVVKAAIVGQAGAQERRRPVGFEIGALIADVGVRGGMSLVKAIAGKSQHLLPQRLGLLRG